MMTAHDDSCEADWGPEGQETPCRCFEFTCPRCGWHTYNARVENHVCPEDPCSPLQPKCIGSSRGGACNCDDPIEWWG